jgi:hypothetical protein
MSSWLQDILIYVRSIFTNFDLRSILSFLGHKLVEGLFQAVVVLLLGWFVVFRHWRQLAQGRSDQVVFSANLLTPIVDRPPPGEPEKYQLQLRTVLPPKTVDQLLDNLALRQLIRRLAEAATLTDPVLATDGTAGFEIVTDVVNNVSGTLASSAFPREHWLVAVTCEDRRLVRKRCIRVLLVRRVDIEKLASWDWCCNHILVEEWYHFWRIVTLHQIALRFRDEQSNQDRARAQDITKGLLPLVDAQAFHPRIRAVSLGINTNEPIIKSPRPIDWDHYLPDIAAMGLKLTGMATDQTPA